MSLNDEWLKFDVDNVREFTSLKDNKNLEIPKASDLHISTQTKIVFLNYGVDLYDIFWKINIMPFWKPKNGIIKKSIRYNFNTKKDRDNTKTTFGNIENIGKSHIHVLKQIDTEKRFKEIWKVEIGYRNKDFTSLKNKKKGSFYNCFSIIMRIKMKNNSFKEIHIKIFNTGKLEIPGIQDSESLVKALDFLVNILREKTGKKDLNYNNEFETVLTNTNFTCNYFINRDKLYSLLKFKYNLHTLYNPCSYPGIQCKFYMNENNKKKDGICYCSSKCWKRKDKKIGCNEISFMIFRTGSILVVANSDKKRIEKVYEFIKKILYDEYVNIYIQNNSEVKKKKKKRRKKMMFLIDVGKNNKTKITEK